MLRAIFLSTLIFICFRTKAQEGSLQNVAATVSRIILTKDYKGFDKISLSFAEYERLYTTYTNIAKDYQKETQIAFDSLAFQKLVRYNHALIDSIHSVNSKDTVNSYSLDSVQFSSFSYEIRNGPNRFAPVAVLLLYFKKGESVIKLLNPLYCYQTEGQWKMGGFVWPEGGLELIKQEEVAEYNFWKQHFSDIVYDTFPQKFANQLWKSFNAYDTTLFKQLLFSFDEHKYFLDNRLEKLTITPKEQQFYQNELAAHFKNIYRNNRNGCFIHLPINQSSIEYCIANGPKTFLGNYIAINFSYIVDCNTLTGIGGNRIGTFRLKPTKNYWKLFYMEEKVVSYPKSQYALPIPLYEYSRAWYQ